MIQCGKKERQCGKKKKMEIKVMMKWIGIWKWKHFPERGDVVKVGIIIGFRGMFNRVYVSVFVRYLCVELVCHNDPYESQQSYWWPH